MNRITLITKSEVGYELLDSGNQEKLERFGDVVLARPDPQALWKKHVSPETWEGATGTYVKESGEGNKREGKWVGEAAARVADRVWGTQNEYQSNLF